MDVLHVLLSVAGVIGLAILLTMLIVLYILLLISFSGDSSESPGMRVLKGWADDNHYLLALIWTGPCGYGRRMWAFIEVTDRRTGLDRKGWVEILPPRTGRPLDRARVRWIRGRS